MSNESTIELPLPMNKGQAANAAIDEQLKAMTAKTLEAMNQSHAKVAHDPTDWQVRVGNVSIIGSDCSIPLSVKPSPDALRAAQAEAQKQFDAARQSLEEEIKELEQYARMTESYSRLIANQEAISKNRRQAESIDSLEREFIEDGVINGFNAANAGQERERLRIEKLTLIGLQEKLAREFDKRKIACSNRAFSLASAARIKIWQARDEARQLVPLDSGSFKNSIECLLASELLGGQAMGLESAARACVDSAVPPLPLPDADTLSPANVFALHRPGLVRPAPNANVGWVQH